jgi:AbrB family looped-hinge helix DNA binding protein
MATLMSKITTKFQTTVPSGVRKALDLAPGDQVAYVIRGNRALIVKARAEETQDPALDGFLDLLATSGHTLSASSISRRRLSLACATPRRRSRSTSTRRSLEP